MGYRPGSSGGGGTGYPNDIRPNSTVVKDINTGATVTSLASDNAIASLKIIGALYSPSSTVQVVSSSSDYITASIVSQTYVNHSQINFTFSSSLGSAPGSTVEYIKLAAQSAGNADDGPQLLSLTTNWFPTNITSCSFWLDASDASSITLDGSTVLKWINKSTDHPGIFDYHQSNSSYQPLVPFQSSIARKDLSFA